MKVFIVLFAVVFAACAVNGLPEDSEQRKKAEEHIAHCMKEGEVDADVAKKLTFGDFSVRDKKAQCFVQCFFKLSEFMNEAGEPQKDVIIAKLASKSGVKNEKLEELIESCVQEKGEDSCETAYKIFECYWSKRAPAIPTPA